MAVTPPHIPRALEFPWLAEATEPPSGWAVLAVLAFALLSLWCHFVANLFGIPVVYSALFAVHEAGHVVIGLLSQAAGVYGGTLFQLLFPLLFIHHAARRGQLTAVAASGVWLGESLLNMAAYMADARARLLPLVGFTDEPGHDWEIIFSRWGVLQHDLLIANLARSLALLVMALAVGWLLLCWWSAGHDAKGYWLLIGITTWTGTIPGLEATVIVLLTFVLSGLSYVLVRRIGVLRTWFGMAPAPIGRTSKR